MKEQKILKRLRNKIFALIMGILILPIMIIILLIYQNINYNAMIKEGLGQDIEEKAYRISLNVSRDVRNGLLELDNASQDCYDRIIGRHYRETLYLLHKNGRILYTNDQQTEPFLQEKEEIIQWIREIDETSPKQVYGHKEYDAYGQYGRQMMMGYAVVNSNEETAPEGVVLLFTQTARLLPDENVYRAMFFITIFIGGGILVKVLMKFSEVILDQFIRVNQNLQSASAEADHIRKKLIISEKLAAMGRVTSGIAHEIGNPLASISSMCQILERPNLPAEKRQEYVEKIKQDTDRIDGIIKEFLYFSGNKPLENHPLDINEVVKKSIQTIPEKRKNTRVTIYEDYATNLPRISGDATKLEMVFANIFLNAFQVIEAEGSIFVRTMKKQSSVQISIRDTGRGIEDKDIDHIFDPFYTTKPVGKGSGLGLYICQQIVEAHQGSIKVKTEEQAGTEFMIRLPIEKA
ncbi:Signal transduction histidine kinase [Tindallia magadiensis]|uniref:histidine kinase n=1 Tax=Tindallia magadiensis TaxID=69895 RepID=A0A1I3CWT0_9FIRM|nr:ATP-binding protein [Tindallia magadiensis]SFH79004.1 Signal transduction histidine kinase [Tindallia magadiensis]